MNAIVGAENIALLYESQVLGSRADKCAARCDWNENERLLLLALEKWQNAVGSSDPSIGAILDKLGQAYLALNLIEKAMDAFGEAASLLEMDYHAGHASLAPILEHEADCFIRQQRYAEALPLLKRALEINEKTISSEHRSTLKCMQKLANLYSKLDRPVDAEGLLTKAMKHVDTPLGPAEEFRYQLALVYLQQNKHEEAIEQLLQAIKDFRQRHNYGRLSDCLVIYSNVLRQSGQLESADQVNANAGHYRELAAVSPYPQDIYPTTFLRM
ncbi:MAG: tetratricopeptide repeat protein [Candidatus Melainabacteria bacterium]|nr:tetratricopeptide repeat protein [Candidatus Melainabacteria bacterium]